jgi:PleD family two-component response regulator
MKPYTFSCSPYPSDMFSRTINPFSDEEDIGMGVRILIAYNHELVRSAMSQLIRNVGWEVCGPVSDGKAAIETALALQPDLVILDYRMPDRGPPRPKRKLD